MTRKIAKINQKKKENNMEEIEYSNSLYQVNEILKYMAPNLKARIPKRIISYFENNKSKNYSWSIDKSLPLESQDLLTPTKEILTLLYRDYICDDIERIKIQKTLSENDIKYQKELKEKYNPDNIFKNKQKNIKVTEKETQDTTSMSTCRESFFIKIIDKIKLFFHK